MHVAGNRIAEAHMYCRLARFSFRSIQSSCAHVDMTSRLTFCKLQSGTTPTPLAIKSQQLSSLRTYVGRTESLKQQPTNPTPASAVAPDPSRRRGRRIGVPCTAAAQQGLSYKDAGVDIDAGNELVRRIRKLNPAIGGFSGAYEYGDSYLVAGTDGVGTKLKLAFELGRHDTIGIDLVAMSVNDIVTCGAKPMFFLDYYATGALDVDVAEDVVKGIVAGCQESDCILMGGETAEMPGMYQAGEYDLAGFAVGSVKKTDFINGSAIAEGDAVLGLPSSGVHSNGFSLVRKILEVSGTRLTDAAPWGGGTFGDALLAPTVLYVRPVLKLMQQLPVKGLIHMTGGGFPENIPRVVPKGLQTRVDRSAWDVPELFKWLQKAGGVSDDEMFRTFNMGVGMVVVVAPEHADAVLAAGIGAFRLGDIAAGEGVQLVDHL